MAKQKTVAICYGYDDNEYVKPNTINKCRHWGGLITYER